MATARSKPVIEGILADLMDEVEIPEPLVVTPTITISMPTRRQMREYYEAEDGDGRNVAILGEHYDKLVELFDDKPAQLWNEFIRTISEHFFGPGSTRVEGN